MYEIIVQIQQEQIFDVSNEYQYWRGYGSSPDYQTKGALQFC